MSSNADTNTNTTSDTTDADNDTANFQSDLAADRNGYFARLANRVFGSDGFLGTFADEQRLERLDGCKALEGDWDHCLRIQKRLEEVERVRLEESAGGGGFWGRRKNKQGAAAAAEVDTQADGGVDTNYVPSQSATKTRIARFYDWGEPDGDAAEAPADGDGAAVPAISASCHRETHSVWACRALAVGCADHLVPLRKCLQRTGTTATHYEGSAAEASNQDGFSNGSVDECILEQRALAQCVNIKLEELDKRFRDRQRK